MPIRVLNQHGKGDTDDVIKAIHHAVNKGADIINLSLGADRHVQALEDAVEYATGKRVFVVTSAGNTGSSMTYPAAQATSVSHNRYLMSVGSVNDSGNFSSFSSRGNQLEFLAPGEKVYSSGPSDKKFHASGTSFAAPLVAGAVALGLSEMESRGISDKGWNFNTYLKQTATKKPCGGRTCYLININKFITNLDGYVKKKILFVVGSSNLNASDEAVKEHLENLGYNVIVKDDDAISKSQATGTALVVISATASSSKVGATFRDVTVPVIVWEDHIWDDMKLASSKGSIKDSNATQYINIVNTNHPLAAGLSGKIRLYKTNQDFAWGQHSSSAIVLARAATNSTKSISFAYEKGAAMMGMKAPARRVALYGGDDNFESADLANHGILLLEAAVTWAVSGN